MVSAGTYKEKLTIDKDNITMKGPTFLSMDPAGNMVTITAATYAKDVKNNDASGLSLPHSRFMPNFSQRAFKKEGTGNMVIEEVLKHIFSNPPSNSQQLRPLQHRRYQHSRHRRPSRRPLRQRHGMRILRLQYHGVPGYAVRTLGQLVLRIVLCGGWCGFRVWYYGTGVVAGL